MTTRILVGAEPERALFHATAFDGQSATPRPVTLHVDDARAALTGPGIDWPLADIREVPDQAGGDIMVLRLAKDPVQRLILSDRRLATRLPNRHKRAPVTRRGRLLGWAVAALASVALIVFVLVPLMADQLAEYIPPEGEHALGQVTLDRIREAMTETELAPTGFCAAPDGLSALHKIEARLTGDMALRSPLSVHVLDHDMVNAFALPGGYVVFFRGLIDAAEQPEELAAVFAHEIGHVVSRDPTRNALRSAGSIGVLGLLFGDFAGGALVLFLTERLIDAHYSQAAESAADVFATRALLDAGLPPSALADMFERFRALGGDVDGFLAHFLSHPQLGNRIEAARAATPPDFRALPVLTSDEWAALKTICEPTR